MCLRKLTGINTLLEDDSFLEVDENLNVTGNTCPRGKTYGIAEVTNPTRMITSTVRLINSKERMLSMSIE